MSVSGLIPSLLLPEVYGPWKAEPGFIVRQVKKAAEDGFYRSVELSPVADREERSAIRRICDENGIQVSCWLTQLIDDEKLDLTSADETLRQHSVEVIKHALPAAIECGAQTVAFIGGPDPGPSLRQRGYESFYLSMTAICAAADNLGAAVMFEPLDRFAHKKRLIGPTNEIIAAFSRVRAEYPTFGLAFDTAHAALNEEDIAFALRLADGLVTNIHLSNAVLDKSDPLYGDHHMMPGLPGFLTLGRAASIAAEASNLPIARSKGLRISVEARASPDDDRQATAKLAATFLKEVLATAAPAMRDADRLSVGPDGLADRHGVSVRP